MMDQVPTTLPVENCIRCGPVNPTGDPGHKCTTGHVTYPRHCRLNTDPNARPHDLVFFNGTPVAS